jgi:hypothetical protein
MPVAFSHIAAMLVVSTVLLQTVCGVVTRPSDRALSDSALPECEGELEWEESRLSDEHDRMQPQAVVFTTFSLLADQIYSGCVVAVRCLRSSDSTLLVAASRAPPAR